MARLATDSQTGPTHAVPLPLCKRSTGIRAYTDNLPLSLTLSRWPHPLRRQRFLASPGQELPNQTVKHHHTWNIGLLKTTCAGFCWSFSCLPEELFHKTLQTLQSKCRMDQLADASSNFVSSTRPCSPECACSSAGGAAALASACTSGSCICWTVARSIQHKTAESTTSINLDSQPSPKPTLPVPFCKSSTCTRALTLQRWPHPLRRQRFLASPGQELPNQTVKHHRTWNIGLLKTTCAGFCWSFSCLPEELFHKTLQTLQSKCRMDQLADASSNFVRSTRPCSPECACSSAGGAAALASACTSGSCICWTVARSIQHKTAESTTSINLDSQPSPKPTLPVPFCKSSTCTRALTL